MRWMVYAVEAFNALFRRGRVEAELEEEVRFHLEMEIEKNLRAGMTPEEARRVALLRFGGVEQVKEEVREESGVRWLEDMLMDLRYAARQLRRNPAFTAVAVLTLALGIGANTAVFSVLHSVILSPLGYHEPGRLVRIYQSHRTYGTDVWVSGPAFLDYREQLEGVESVTAMYNYREMGFTLTGAGSARRVTMLPVSSDFFDVYRVHPVIGRPFVRDEERGSARIAVLSHRLWQAISGDAGVLGQRLELDGDPYEVIGVMPAGFVDVVGGDVDLWVPLELQDENARENRGNHYLSVVARLRPDVTLGQARSRLASLATSQAELYPNQHEDWSAEMVPLRDDLVGASRTMLFVLLGASGLVLLIACVNVASLFLSRNVARERELAVRAAIGAGRFRLTRQLVTESIVIALIGGAAGLALAHWGVGVLLPLSSDAVPRAREVSFDATLFVFALGVTLFTVVIFGLAPALQFVSPELDRSLREDSRTGTGGARSRRVRDVLVTSQVALAILLLIGAGLLMRSLLSLQAVDLGISPRDAMTFQVHLGGPRYADPAARIAFHREYQDRLRAYSGVRAVGAVSKLPVSDQYNSWTFTYLSASGEVMRHGGGADFRVIEGDFFEALNIELLAGRRFGPSDHADAPQVAIVNQSLARRYYEGRDPLGQRIADPSVWTIVGVVADVAHDGRGSVTGKVYLPHAQFGDDRNWALTQIVATTIPRRDLLEIARQELRAIDPQLVIHNPRSMREVTGSAIAQERFVFLLLAIFAAVALSLAAVGIYGVMAYNVGRRTREFGIRLALGASPLAVRRSVLRQGSAIVGIGILGGLVGAFLLSRLLRSMLFGVGATDPLTFVLVPLALASVALLAGYLPARRATKVDPLRVLRQE
ncbi:MAG: ABC transporter permease [Gemmatimonadota bacterium]|nr:MAG: ABC transporter permease [Gemmatimonadota bacterium]